MAGQLHPGLPRVQQCGVTPFGGASLERRRKYNLVFFNKERVALVGMPTFLLLKKVRLVFDKLLKVRAILLLLLCLSIAERVPLREIHFGIHCKGVD